MPQFGYESARALVSVEEVAHGSLEGSHGGLACDHRLLLPSCGEQGEMAGLGASVGSKWAIDAIVGETVF